MLTFVDMSKLKYLSRSMNTNNDKLSRKKHVVELPKNTDVSIVEAPNEEDSDGETPTKVNDNGDDGEGSGEQSAKQTSPKDFALEVINELIDIVLESAGEAKTLESSEIVSNALLQ